MRKLFCLALALLFLTGCSQKAPVSTEAPTTQPTLPAPTPTGEYLLAEQIYYDAQDRVSVHMTVSFNEQKLPTSIFLDSGADVTYTPEYDENGMVTAFSMSKVLYGEETITEYLLNDHGDIIQQTANGKTRDIIYSYDSSGRVIKKETSSDGNLVSVKTWSYDCWDNLATASSTDGNGGYSLIYENTYEGNLLTAIDCKFEGGEMEHTERFAYDAQGRLTEHTQVSGEETTVTVYTYNEAGLKATETAILNGSEYSRTEYGYDDRGLLAEKQTYSYGEFTGRTTYTWTEAPVELTPAQRNVLEQLGVLL